MPYEVYKVIHLAAIFVFLTSAAVLLVSEKKTRFWKMLTGISSFFILLAGMGLVARLYPSSQGGGGFGHAWVQGKIAIWLFVTGLGHLVAKRFPKAGVSAYWATVILAILAAGLAVYKPG